MLFLLFSSSSFKHLLIMSDGSYTRGLNPMYQSFSTQQSEYDVIGESQSCLIPPSSAPSSARSSRVVTENTLYASVSQPFRHPTLKHNASMSSCYQADDVRFSSVPLIKPPFQQDKKSSSCGGSGSTCFASFCDVMVALCSCVTIGLSSKCIGLYIIGIILTCEYTFFPYS